MTQTQDKSLEQLDRELAQATELGQREMAALRDQWEETEALIATTVEAHQAHHHPTYPATPNLLTAAIAARASLGIALLSITLGLAVGYLLWGLT